MLEPFMFLVSLRPPLLPVVRALPVLALEVLAHEVLGQPPRVRIESPGDERHLGELFRTTA